jgi:hypothetical protein
VDLRRREGIYILQVQRWCGTNRSLLTLNRSLLTLNKSLLTLNKSLLTLNRSLLTLNRGRAYTSCKCTLLENPECLGEPILSRTHSARETCGPQKGDMWTAEGTLSIENPFYGEHILRQKHVDLRRREGIYISQLVV